MMHRSCENSIGFLVHLTNVYINDQDKLEVRGPLPIYRIFDNDSNSSSDEMAVRMTSYPLGISPTFKIDANRREEINFNEILKLKNIFRMKMSLYFQSQSLNSETAFEELILQRIRRFEEVKFRAKMAALDRVSQETQTWSKAKRRLNFLGITPKLSVESEDESPIKKKKKRRRIVSDSSDEETTPANVMDQTNVDLGEAKVFDYSPSQLETMTKNLDINVFDFFMDKEATVADADDNDSDDEVFEEADNSDGENSDFISREETHDGAPGLIYYTKRQQVEFEKICMNIINGDDVAFKWLSINDYCKIVQQSSETIMPFSMKKIKQIISNQIKAEAEEKSLIKNLSPNFIF